jgi:hypothetical protein
MNTLPKQSQEEKDFWCEEYECAIMFLDAKKVAKEVNNKELSLIGRIKLYAGTFDYSSDE